MPQVGEVRGEDFQVVTVGLVEGGEFAAVDVEHGNHFAGEGWKTGTTISERDRELHAICPGKRSTSGTTRVRLSASGATYSPSVVGCGCMPADLEKVPGPVGELRLRGFSLHRSPPRRSRTPLSGWRRCWQGWRCGQSRLRGRIQVGAALLRTVLFYRKLSTGVLLPCGVGLSRSGGKWAQRRRVRCQQPVPCAG